MGVEQVKIYNRRKMTSSGGQKERCFYGGRSSLEYDKGHLAVAIFDAEIFDGCISYQNEKIVVMVEVL